MESFAMLSKALEICYQAHANQVDKAGKPYYLHPIQVALMCNTIDEKVVALLHDVIEDTDYTIDDLIRIGFSKEIIDAIECITKKGNEPYENYIKRVSENPIAKAVKINDITHNSDLTRIKNPTLEDIKRTEKYKEILKHLS